MLLNLTLPYPNLARSVDLVPPGFSPRSGNRNKTLKAPKTHTDKRKSELSQYAKTEYANATLGSGDMRAAVILPPNEDLNEWLAVNSTSLAQTTTRLSYTTQMH